MLQGTSKLKIVAQLFRRKILTSLPGGSVGGELDGPAWKARQKPAQKGFGAGKDNNVDTGKRTGTGLGGDGREGTRLDLEVDADALVVEEQLVGGRYQDGVFGLEKANTQNDGVLKIADDDAGYVEGEAGAEVELDDGDALGLH